MKHTTEPRTARIHLVVTERVRERIIQLQARTESSSMTDVICRALMAYEEVLDQLAPRPAVVDEGLLPEIQ